jgi:hypothetical protein
MRPDDPIDQPRLLYLAGGLLLAAVVLMLLWLQWGRCLAWDELEFLRATQWVGQGRVPYRDFWEHHGPLQWFLMAPLKALVNGPGASTVLWMRWGQLPFWGLAGGCVWVLLQRAKTPVWLALVVCALPLLAPLFTLWAVEYRPDTLASAMLLLGLAVWRVSSRGISMLTVGAALALGAMSNLRMAGICALTFLLCLTVRPASRRWGIHRNWLWLIAGGSLPFLLWGAYLVSTGSTVQAYRFLVIDNTWFNSMHHSSWKTSPCLMPFHQWDLAAMLLVVVAVSMTLLCLMRLRRPGLSSVLALVQLGQLVSISKLSVNYPYHLQGVLVIAVLQLGLWASVQYRSLSHHARQSAAKWVINAGICLLGYAWIHLGVANTRTILKFQDRTMLKLDRMLAPSDRVLDGVGFALRHEPAYPSCWFLPTLARALSLQGRLPAYSSGQLLSNPPGAIIFSGRLYMWLEEWPPLQGVVSSHYLPETPFIWKPGLSARLSQDAPSAAWTVPRTGRYRIHASEPLASHPWFTAPFRFYFLRGAPAAGIQVDSTASSMLVPGTLAWRVNHAQLKVAEGWVHLNQGDKLQVELKGSAPVGIFLVPEQTPSIFQGTIPGETLDSDLLNVWPNL